MRKTRMSMLAALVVLGAAAFAASPAKADHHFVKISEVGVSAAGPSDQHYIELQMYASGQNQIAGRSVTFWDNDGLAPPMSLPGPIGEATLSVGNPENAESQRTVLIGDTGIQGRDYTIQSLTSFFDPGVTNNILEAGAICFEEIDCLSWGGEDFTGEAHIPDHSAPLPASIASLLGVTAHHRTLARGCATSLDAADDTDDSSADFTGATPTPRPNATMPTEVLCANPAPATPAKKAKKCKRKKAKKGEVSAAAKKKCKRKKRT
jgi:hypothetical protein